MYMKNVIFSGFKHLKITMIDYLSSYLDSEGFITEWSFEPPTFDRYFNEMDDSRGGNARRHKFCDLMTISL